MNWAWECWRDDQSLDLMGYLSSTLVVLRFINIGLLRVQEKMLDQPTMLDVILMISNEHAPLSTYTRNLFLLEVGM
jgi:hypothetical protein